MNGNEANLNEYGNNLRAYAADHLSKLLTIDKNREKLGSIFPSAISNKDGKVEEVHQGEIDCTAADFYIPLRNFPNALERYAEKMFKFENPEQKWLGELHFRLISDYFKRPLIVGKSEKQKLTFIGYDFNDKENGVYNIKFICIYINII